MSEFQSDDTTGYHPMTGEKLPFGKVVLQPKGRIKEMYVFDQNNKQVLRITTSGQISNIQEQESFLIKEQADTNKTQDASKSKHFALHSAFMHAEKYIKELITVESANLKSTFIKTAIAVGGIATICMAFDKQEMLSRSSHLIAETSNFLWTYAADSTFLTIDGAAIGMMVSMYNSEKPILSPAMFKEGMKSAFIAASIGLCIGVGLDWVDASPSPQLSAPSAIISPN